MKKPLVSIITVVKNAKETIEQTIISVIQQSYHDIEYIVIDGCSSDGTTDIIKKYLTQISIFVCEPDNGIYDAMNKGISLSHGEIIGILNADDYYETDAVDKVIDYYNKQLGDVFYGDAIQFDENGNKRLYEVNIDELWFRMSLAHPAVFVTKKTYRKHGKFNEKYELAADFDLMLRYYRAGAKFIRVPQVLVHFRNGGISQSSSLLCEREAFQIAMKYSSLEKDKTKIDYISNRFEMTIFDIFLNNRDERICKRLSELIGKRKNVAIFGTGHWGKSLGSFIREQKLFLDCFIDSLQSDDATFCDTRIVRPEAMKGYRGTVLIASFLRDEEMCNLIREVDSKIYFIRLIELKNAIF